MPIGAGKYDDLATYVRATAQGTAAVVLVVQGNRGTGFSVQMGASDATDAGEQLLELAKAIRAVAEAMERDARRMLAEKRGN